ncbi:threonine/serine exporter family protein [Gorillibacterium massiliense]|uniref:threonine/serine exporter family protein n=1 Tax=Gorillibacterium massiliense TaxID=1280390 RepID=UPI0004BBE856|nr:threonine/serine exporter family protein [Gorillibacterium massiliense]
MRQKVAPSNRLMDMCLLAGKIMLENGAETYRVEDTMMRIAAAFGKGASHSFVTPTGIIFSVDGTSPAQMVRVLERSTDLRKVTLVNSVSRQMSTGDLSLEAGYRKLQEIDVLGAAYPAWLRLLAAALSSGCFTIMFMAGWVDFLPAILAGGIGFAGFLFIHRFVQIRFFSEFSASFLIGAVAWLMVKIGFGLEVDKIIIGSVMPLVPGLLITSAVRDLMAGHLVSGLSKGAEAFLTAFAIGAGIAVSLSLH